MSGERSIGFLPNKRSTFVIDTDRRVIGVFHSETNMSSHADKALELLRTRSGSPQ